MDKVGANNHISVTAGYSASGEVMRNERESVSDFCRVNGSYVGVLCSVYIQQKEEKSK